LTQATILFVSELRYRATSLCAETESNFTFVTFFKQTDSNSESASTELKLEASAVQLTGARLAPHSEVLRIFERLLIAC